MRGIHESMAGRLVKLLKAIKVDDAAVLMTGGLALDHGLLGAIRDEMAGRKVEVDVTSSPDSIYAGAIGAALWGAFRHQKLAALGQLQQAS